MLYQFTCARCGVLFSDTHRVRRFCSHTCNGLATPHPPRPQKPALGRFLPKVDRSGECWIWKGYCRPGGHGLFRLEGRDVGAHVAAWLLLVGPIPDGLWVLHNCPGGDNPSCVNPAHLWLGTVLDNNRDMIAKGRAAHGDRHPFHVRPEIRPRGEGHGQARLTEVDVLRIRELHAGGMLLAHIAKQFGLDRTHTADIVRRKAWTHI